MKILIFNVKFSENIGDGLLATCLENNLGCLLPDADIETIDLAGRCDYGQTSRHRRLVLTMLHRLPRYLRRRAMRMLLARKVEALARQWAQKIKDADAVVIGGGNLFQDDDLNFPTKIGGVLDHVSRHGLPLAVYGVGVGGHWSPEAAQLFGHIDRTHLVHCSVRDEIASAAWHSHFPDSPPPRVVPDPALCPWTPSIGRMKADDDKRHIGICVTDPLILHRHASGDDGKISLIQIDEYCTLIGDFSDRDCKITLFTNGAQEDEKRLNAILSQPDIKPLVARGLLHRAAKPEKPEYLLKVIGACDSIVAHRLHACIAAYSLSIPNVGLDWDNKVRGFFASVGREKFCAKRNTLPAEIAAMTIDSMNTGIDDQKHAAIQQKAINAVAMLADDLRLQNRPSSKAA